MVFIFFFLFSFFFFILFFFGYSVHTRFNKNVKAMHLRSKPCNIKMYLVCTWAGSHQLRSKCLNYTHTHARTHTYIHSRRHTQSQMEQINFHSFCSKTKFHLLRKTFYNRFFFCSLIKKGKKNLAASEWQNFLLFPSPCEQRCSLSLAVVTFFPLCLFSLRHSVQKKCAVIVR